MRFITKEDRAEVMRYGVWAVNYNLRYKTPSNGKVSVSITKWGQLTVETVSLICQIRRLTPHCIIVCSTPHCMLYFTLYYRVQYCTLNYSV